MNLDEFDTAQEGARRSRPCLFCEQVDRILTKAQQAKLLAALDAERYTAPTIIKVLEGWGVKVGREAVLRHRPFGTSASRKYCPAKYPNGKPTP